MRLVQTFATLLIVLFSAGPATAAPAPQLDLDELAKVGAQTERKLATTPASSTAEHTLGERRGDEVFHDPTV